MNLNVMVVFADGRTKTVNEVSNINVRETGELWLFHAPGSKPKLLVMPGEWLAFSVITDTVTDTTEATTT